MSNKQKSEFLAGLLAGWLSKTGERHAIHCVVEQDGAVIASVNGSETRLSGAEAAEMVLESKQTYSISMMARKTGEVVEL